MPNLSIGTVLLTVGALLALLLLSGCVTRRAPQDFACKRLLAISETGRGSALVRDIQRDAFPPTGTSAGLSAEPQGSLEKAIAGVVARSENNVASPQNNILLLSGGGQWGAYGAGLFEQLSKSNTGIALPDIGIITGISTGSLQTLLLMVALDPAKDADVRALAIDRLVAGYSPGRESDIVRNTGMLGVPLFGSQAGTGPLRRLIGKTLHPKDARSLIPEIQSSTIAGFIGFVEADTGDFRYVHINRLVKGLEPEAAAECLTAAAMASSAMPVFHQQLRVASGSDGAMRTLYDGGARRSVFFHAAMEEVDRLVRSKIAPSDPLFEGDFASTYRDIAPTVYVVRNGPTVRALDTSLNRRAGVISSGKRGYDLLVNEGEISAIAALRLHNPYGNILVTTADEYASEGKPACLAIKSGKMFDPDFMACLRRLGAEKAGRQRNGHPVGPWWPLSPLDRLEAKKEVR